MENKTSEDSELRFKRTTFPDKTVVVMGVSGCGKTTVGSALAKALGCAFYDADDYHPKENIAKMSRGEALNDTDRKPWLERLSGLIDSGKGRGIILACSALKQSYRDILTENTPVMFVYLKGDRKLIAKRIATREHFMPLGLLESQFADLEIPEPAIQVSIDQGVSSIVEEVLNQLAQ